MLCCCSFSVVLVFCLIFWCSCPCPSCVYFLCVLFQWLVHVDFGVFILCVLLLFSLTRIVGFLTSCVPPCVVSHSLVCPCLIFWCVVSVWLSSLVFSVVCVFVFWWFCVCGSLFFHVLSEIQSLRVRSHRIVLLLLLRVLVHLLILWMMFYRSFSVLVVLVLMNSDSL